jgi:hypothetical protein
MSLFSNKLFLRTSVACKGQIELVESGRGPQQGKRGVAYLHIAAGLLSA